MLFQVRLCCNRFFGLLLVPSIGWVAFCWPIPRRNSYNQVICPIFHFLDVLRQCLKFWFLYANWRMIFIMYTISNLPKVSLAPDRGIYETALRLEEPHRMQDHPRARVKIDNYFKNCPKPCLPQKMVSPEVQSLYKTDPNDEFRCHHDLHGSLNNWLEHSDQYWWWMCLKLNIMHSVDLLLHECRILSLNHESRFPY